MTDITVLAVSRLSGGCCVAGVDGEGNWVRPTRVKPGWRQMERADLSDRDGNLVVQKGNVVSFDLAEAIPRPRDGHTEDWRLGDQPPQLVRKLKPHEQAELCGAIQEEAISEIEPSERSRSLMLVHPDEVLEFSFQHETSWEGQTRYTPRCTFVLGGRRFSGVGISDAEWRGLGRRLMAEHDDPCSVGSAVLFEELGTEDCWLTVGGYDVGSTAYLLIVGVLLLPPKHFRMDFKR